MTTLAAMTDQWNDAARAHRVVVDEPTPDGLDRVRYADAFALTLSGGDRRSPEELLRSALESMPAPVHQLVLTAWRGLGFDLGPLDAPDHVLGAAIVRRGPELIEVAPAGHPVSARLVVRRSGAEIRTTTFISVDGLPGRLRWATVAPAHRRVVRLLMNRAARRGEA